MKRIRARKLDLLELVMERRLVRLYELAEKFGSSREGVNVTPSLLKKAGPARGAKNTRKLQLPKCVVCAHSLVAGISTLLQPLHNVAYCYPTLRLPRMCY